MKAAAHLSARTDDARNRAFLELHHVVPFAAGGGCNASNIQLRCRAHNLYEADLFFGADAVQESAVRPP